jgi:lipopolysaccharide/colanic/teichoic acid biosynthesis glycosyltransferase
MKNKNKQRILYILFDFLAAMAAWVLFFIFRKIQIEPQVYGTEVPLTFGPRFWAGTISLPFAWILLYYFTGFYKNLFRRSRLDDFIRTLLSSLLGVLIIFFLLILDDTILDYTNYYSLFITLFLLHFTFVLIPRMIITSRMVARVHNREISFKTVFIGSNENAVDFYQDIMDQKWSNGYEILGFINVQKKEHYQLQDHMKHLGGHENMESIITDMGIEEVIIALEPIEHHKIGDIVSRLSLLDVKISAIPSMTDILTGKVKSTIIFGTPLLEVNQDVMPAWQQNVKQLADILISILSLIILLPLIIFLMVGVKLSSSGPVLYKQDRVGRYGRDFKIFKIRIAPHYVHLHKVKPGITSWGQVKYGYAENVEEMIKRLRFDLLYIENMSLFVDAKILFYTVITIIRGRGV